MAKTSFITNSKQFIRKLNKINRVYRKKVMQGLADSITETRKRAGDKFIIDRNVKKTSPFKMAREQPPSRNKLTERTGLYKQVYNEKQGRWDFKPSTARWVSFGFNSTIRVMGKGTERETYRAILEVSPKNSGGEQKAVRFRMLNEQGVLKKSKRPRRALEPALGQQRLKFEPLISARTREIFNIKL